MSLLTVNAKVEYRKNNVVCTIHFRVAVKCEQCHETSFFFFCYILHLSSPTFSVLPKFTTTSRLSSIGKSNFINMSRGPECELAFNSVDN